MGVRSWHLVIFSLCLFISSGPGIAIRLRYEENEDISSPYESSTQFDSVPVINPTTPGTDNPYPTLNPTSPQPPDTTGPGLTPTTPDTTPTTPDTNPYTTPTTPNTNPTAPTSPYTNPTTPTSPPPSPNANPTAPTTPTTTSAGGQWCVASQSASEKALKVAIDYACGYGGADCSALQPGASCYNPNTIRDHASYAFNDYYQKNPAPTSCAFGGTATLTNKDPSNGNCHYASSKTTSMSPPTHLSPPNPPTPPSAPATMTPSAPNTMIPTTPPGMTIPGGASVDGSGPALSPNIATSASYSTLLLFTLFGIWASIHVHIYI
ncbi:PREDICTED: PLASMODESMATA CALLOSE-BINDING PROTEIN 3-like [Lupinus angustifolius]|uniref:PLASMODESMATA CALLOSE-BINDING PROTEIN 3-like n=1 Tax=Lupinus angustifolius TaxID=3871 RepID=UPI00092E7455|nr:PREDICTED: PLASMODESMATA CALLOSE-BINDING PROTEIN 3-like [Lupinus angustifolius]